jgi:hypothetical protein
MSEIFGAAYGAIKKSRLANKKLLFSGYLSIQVFGNK